MNISEKHREEAHASETDIQVRISGPEGASLDEQERVREVVDNVLSQYGINIGQVHFSHVDREEPNAGSLVSAQIISTHTTDHPVKQAWKSARSELEDSLKQALQDRDPTVQAVGSRAWPSEPYIQGESRPIEMLSSYDVYIEKGPEPGRK